MGDHEDLVMDVIHLDERVVELKENLGHAREDIAKGDEAWQKVEEDIREINGALQTVRESTGRLYLAQQELESRLSMFIESQRNVTDEIYSHLEQAGILPKINLV